MDTYYYHGIETYHGTYGQSTEIMYKILREGLKTRKEVHNHHDDHYDHVCLYKKDKDLDYKKNFFDSARSGWIDSCFVFIISPDVEAVRASHDETDLLDEWRSIGSIPPSKIKGIALPMTAIKDYLEEEPLDEEHKQDQEKLKKYLKILTEYTLNNDLMLLDSDLPNFTDELDESLKKKKLLQNKSVNQGTFYFD